MKYSYVVVNCLITNKIDGDSVNMDDGIVQMDDGTCLTINDEIQLHCCQLCYHMQN